MQFRIHAAVLTMACLLGLPGITAAQTSDVTFTFPLQLTKLSSEITQIQVDCTIDSPGVLSIRNRADGTRSSSATGSLNVPVTGGQVVMSKATVVVALDVNSFEGAPDKIAAVGKGASYRCHLIGYTGSALSKTKMWSAFSETSTNVAFRLSPTPVDITGKFTWQ